MKTLNSIVRRINTVFGLASEGVVFLLMLLVTAEIIGRHVFGTPIPGQVEMATLSLIVILYLGLSYTQLEGGHIRVDILTSRIKGRKRELFGAFAAFLCLIPSVMMLLATAERARISVIGKEFVAGVINFPVWPGRCAVTLGFALLCLTLVIQISNHIIAAFKTSEPQKED
jgi:TRAP-type C4-dicarboxylate transport system permease small subunit